MTEIIACFRFWVDEASVDIEEFSGALIALAQTFGFITEGELIAKGKSETRPLPDDADWNER